jgi:hypothetical protein
MQARGNFVVVMCGLLLASTHAYGQEAAKPTYVDRFNGGTEEAEYVLEKVARSGREVTLTISAKLTKGPERRSIMYFGVNMVDADGVEHKARINSNAAGRTRPHEATLRAGVKTKLEIRFPLEKSVTSLQVLEVTSAFVERVAIRFDDVEIPAR